MCNIDTCRRVNDIFHLNTNSIWKPAATTEAKPANTTRNTEHSQQLAAAALTHTQLKRAAKAKAASAKQSEQKLLLSWANSA